MAYTNNPVRVTVAYYDHNDTSNNKKVSFHQLIITVTASVSGKAAVVQTFSEPCSNTGAGTVSFDIHTCLQAAAESIEWSATSLGAAPSVSYTYTVKEEYLLDGEAKSANGAGGNGSATVGGLSDRERLAGVTSKTTSKPTATSPQIAASDEDVVVGGTLAEGTASGKIYRLIDTLAALPDRYIFRFINRYGCMESIGVECLRETEMHVDSSEYRISRPETFNSFSRARYSKQNDYETWKLSSGPLDRAWQQWFAHELLMAEHAWLYVGSTWQRVHIVPEETVNLVNRTDNSLLEVLFSVRFDINGDPTGLI